jgi:hypothetical protein
MRLPLLLWLLVPFGAPASAAATVEMTLTSGEVHTGEIVREDEGAVTLAVAVRASTGRHMTGSIIVPRTQIARQRPVQPIAEQYAERLAAAGDSEDAIGRLAVWCLANSLDEEAIAHARRAWERCPGQPDAERVLTTTGHIRSDGEWVLESEHLAARGQVKYRGEVVTTEEGARRKRVDDARYLLIGARERVLGLEGRERKALKGIVEESGRKASSEAAARQAEAFLAENRPRIGVLEDRIRSAKAAYDQAVAFRLSEEHLCVCGHGRAHPGTYLAEQAACDALQAERNAHQILIDQLAKASAARAAALASGAEAQRKLTAYDQTIARARKELVEARTKVEELERQAGIGAGAEEAR